MDRDQNTATTRRYIEPAIVGTIRGASYPPIPQHSKGELCLSVSEALSEAAPISTWQRQITDLFQRTRSDRTDELRTELLDDILALTGRKIPAGAVHVDPDELLARVSVDGVSFRILRGELVLLARCRYCGVVEYASPTIHNLSDLGYALSVWQPYCRDCGPEDKEEW
jgi:hypothetical protein